VSEDLLSQQARHVLDLTESIARRLRHNFIDTEHLLLGIMAEAGSLASQVLFEVGLDLATVENYILQNFQGYPSANEDQRILRTNDIELVLILAHEEASWLGQELINTEHMLLGLTRWQEREGGAITMLKSLGVAPGRVRRTMRQMLQAARLEVGLADLQRMANISEIAHRVLNGAIEEAARAGHLTVGVEHLLLALCRDRRNVAGRVLRQNGATVDSIEALVAQLAFPSLLVPVFNAAVAQASYLGDHYLGTDHLLLAITQDGAGMEVLRYMGLDPIQVQARLREHLQN